jgi:hypothetical protein
VGWLLRLVPFRVFGINRLIRRVAANESSSRGMAARPEFSDRCVSQSSVLRIHFVVGPCLGLVVFRSRHHRNRLAIRDAPLVGFHLPPEYYPVDPSRPDA